MGQCCGSCLCRRGSSRILMLGLDAAGKTTILYQLKLHEAVYTTPTVGFNVEDIELKNGHTFTTWDIGGQDRLRKLWKYYFKGSNGLIYVLDSTDRERLDEAKIELNTILKHDDMKDVPLVILANKQDMPGALNPDVIRQRLSMNSVTSHRWSIHPVCGRTADGLNDAIKALSDLVQDETTV